MRKDGNKQKRGQGRKTPAQLVYLALLASVTAVKSRVLGAAEQVARDVRSDGGRVEGFRLQAPAVELVFWKKARNVLVLRSMTLDNYFQATVAPFPRQLYNL